MPGVLQAVDVKSLSGYKAYSTLSSFKAFLEENPDVYEKLKNDPALAEEVLGNTARQREMMRAQNVQEAPQDNSTVNTSAPADTLTRDEQATQAANEAIIRALAEKEAANKRAQETLRLITQQEALINQARAEAELAAHEAKMENIRAAFDGHPEKAAEFFANTALLQKVIDDQLSLEEALAEAGITLEETSEPDTPEPEASDGPELTETPGPEYIEYPEDQLVHVYGNKYRLGDKEIYDLNHVPSEEEMALDDNGWPKFLNVPAECGPANPDVTYFFESRYGDGRVPGGHSLKRGAAMDLIAPKGLLHEKIYMTGLTDDETMATPFHVPNFSVLQHYGLATMRADYNPVGFLPDMGTNVSGGFFAFSISYCPDDWSGITPEGEVPMLDGCSLTFGELSDAAFRLHLKVKEHDAPEVFDKIFGDKSHCVIEPGKRYFLNVAPANRVEPEFPTFMEHLYNKYERNAQRDPENYPLSPEEYVANYLDNPNAPVRNGKRIGSAGSFGYGAGTAMAKAMPAMPKQAHYGLHPLRISDKGNYYDLAQPAHSRGYDIHPSYCDEGAGTVLRDRTCYDPHGKLPPIRQMAKCAGLDKVVWAMGYDEKAFNNFICVDTNSTSHKFCLEKNEGDFRRVEYKNPRISRTPSTETIEQCQYDTNRERFDWVTVEARPSQKDLGGHPNHNRMVVSEAADITPRETCALADKNIQLGESVQINCPNVTSSNRSDSTFSLNLTCRRVADEPALPVLVNENGFGLNRMPTDLESGIGAHPILNWLPNCTVE